MFWFFLIHHGLQMLSKIKIKWGAGNLEGTQQDHAELYKHPEITDLTIKICEYQNEMELHLAESKHLAGMEKYGPMILSPRIAARTITLAAL